MAGLIAYAPDITYFLRPVHQTLQLFAKGTLPDQTSGRFDNRTGGSVCVANGTKGKFASNRRIGWLFDPETLSGAGWCCLAAGLKALRNKAAFA